MTEAVSRPRGDYTAAELGALAHLYRGEIYRSTIWRTRLDTTTNWSVVTLGVALSITFSSGEASPLPLVLVGILIIFFMVLESRRYRYFNVWRARARARWMETHFYAPMLSEGALNLDDGWQETLARDYRRPRYHIGLLRAMGRRLRRNYVWILLIQTVAYFGKIAVHPTPIASVAEVWERAAVGPIPGEVMVAAGILYNLFWIAFAVITFHIDRAQHRHRLCTAAMG